MPAKTEEAAVCTAMGDILNRIGDKWSVMVVGRLQHGSMRFSELGRAIDGVSQRMLTLTLRNLERDGLVTRKVHPEIPPRVEYGLTELGQTLTGPISALWDWASEHREAVAAARMVYDGAQDEPIRKRA